MCSSDLNHVTRKTNKTLAAEGQSGILGICLTLNEPNQQLILKTDNKSLKNRLHQHEGVTVMDTATLDNNYPQYHNPFYYADTTQSPE